MGLLAFTEVIAANLEWTKNGPQDALLLSPARAATTERDRRGASTMASPMMSDSEVGIVDGMSSNDGMMEFTLDNFLALSHNVSPY